MKKLESSIDEQKKYRVFYRLRQSHFMYLTVKRVTFAVYLQEKVL